MTIGVIAKLKVQLGKNQEFETMTKQLVAAVLANEKGCLLYALHQSREDPQTYIFLERYVDKEALQAHTKTEYYQKFSQQGVNFLAAAPEIELLDSI